MKTLIRTLAAAFIIAISINASAQTTQPRKVKISSTQAVKKKELKERQDIHEAQQPSATKEVKTTAPVKNSISKRTDHVTKMPVKKAAKTKTVMIQAQPKKTSTK
jgi:hypothetical protein